ncbi:MAG TPA: DUF2723 domain-containing protein [bacterium]|nr:DUF2723 domain-containing protein [bacterium]
MLFLLAFFTYLKTLCPTIYVGDSGELVTAASCLGIPHPPGYPIFVILIRLTSIVFPFGSLAERCALASALFGAASVFVLFRICLCVSESDRRNNPPPRFAVLGSTIAAVAFTFSLTFWSQTTIAEVYALTLLMILLILYLVVLWQREPDGKRDHRLLLAAAFIGGLGLSSHHTVALILAALVVYVIYRSPRLLRNSGVVFGATVLGVLGASAYLYLAFRASTNPPLNWGMPETLSRFWDHILRREYGSSSHTERTFALVIKQLGFYASMLVRQFTPLGVILSAIGLAAAVRRRNKALLMLLACFLLSSLFFILYTNYRLIPRDKSLVEVFFIPSFAVAAIFLALGASSVLRKVCDLIKSRSMSAVAAIALAVLVCALPLFANYFYNDKSRNFLTYDYGVNVIKCLPSDDAIVFVDRDMEVFTLLFLKDVERTCPNIEVIDRSGILRRDFYVKDMRLMPEKQRQVAQLQAEHRLFGEETRPICYVPGVDLGGIKEFKLKPVGVATLLVPAKDAGEFSERERDVPDTLVSRSLEDPTIFKDYTSRCVAMVWQLQLGDSYYWQGDRDKGKRLWSDSSRTAGDIMILHTMLAEKAVGCGETQVAIEEYKKIADIRPQDQLVRMNLGMLLEREGRLREALDAFDSVRRADPTFLPALKACVNIEVRLKNFKKAIGTANQIAKLAPRDPNSLRNLGIVHELAGEYQESLAAYRRSVAVSPTFALAYADIALLQEKMGDEDAARDAMRRALALDPDLPTRDARLSQSSLAVELLAEGEASGTEDLESLSADQLQRRMRALVAAKRYSLAIEVCKRLAQLRPNSPQPMVEMGMLLDQTGRLPQAEAAFKKALSIDPDSVEAHNALGVVYAKRKQYKDARREWEAALKLKPDSAGTLSNLKQLEQLGY